MEKGSVIRFADKALQDTFYNLQNGDEQEKEMFQLVNQAMDNLQKNAFAAFKFRRSKYPNFTNSSMEQQIFGSMTYQEAGDLFIRLRAKTQ